MGIALAELLELIDQVFPPETAVDGDVTGLQLQAGRTKVGSVLVCLDVTEEVVAEARSQEYDVLISFHPLLFQPLRALTEAERVGQLSTLLIQSRVALIALHTRVDAHPRGTNALFAHALGMRIRGPLLPNPRCPGYGMGVIAELEAAIPVEELLERVQRCVRQPLRYVPGKAEYIHTVAIVGGSGSAFLAEAMQQRVDAFITGDVKYHAFHQARHHLWLVDAGHAETECFAPEAIVGLLRQHLPPNIRLGTAESSCSPIRWYGFYSGQVGSITSSTVDAEPGVLSGTHRCD
ncbi:MAG: Nif3-like dinuclear metal center hexameric protein [Candidatus Kapabacteria bacterium]|nr:Nif3-like dinuclear metal center hexameric protein [Candidatus Kapabacteria bacterium]MDW7997763.1 Nif3-like dinuclear metal center hexameric protein [Bacteroidota bacterium]MDW8226092.1 Nif3-like dinuclear metal center hexameric protein [Bacteroidota bacterium]